MLMEHKQTDDAEQLERDIIILDMKWVPVFTRIIYMRFDEPSFRQY